MNFDIYNLIYFILPDGSRFSNFFFGDAFLLSFKLFKLFSSFSLIISSKAKETTSISAFLLVFPKPMNCLPSNW